MKPNKSTDAVFSLKAIEPVNAGRYFIRSVRSRRRHDDVTSTSLADAHGSRMRFREARENGRTLAQQVIADTTAGTENYQLCRH